MSPCLQSREGERGELGVWLAFPFPPDCRGVSLPRRAQEKARIRLLVKKLFSKGNLPVKIGYAQGIVKPFGKTKTMLHTGA